MVFRDDREVLLERVAQLEPALAEIATLRERIAQLERENLQLHGLVAKLSPPAPRRKAPSTASGRPALRVRVHGPSGVRDEEIDLDVIKIGRLRESHLLLAHDEVARMHAVIERTSEGFFVIDLGTSSGTRVNGEPVAKSALREGDAIEIGPFVLTVAIDG